MRGLRAAGAGIGVALTGAVALADGPAARFGRPYAVDAVRGQAPTAPPPAGVLGQPRPVPVGPTVTEQRNGVQPPAGSITPPPPAATFGFPTSPGMPGVPAGLPGDPPVVSGPPPGVGGPVVAPNMEAPLVGGGGGTTGLFGLLTGGQGFAGPQRLRLDADFLLWFVKSGPLPQPLVTTGGPDGFGFLGAPDTRVLFGGDTAGRTLHAGARFGGTYWLDDSSRWGVDGSLFFLNRRGYEETFTTAQFPLLARPFFNLNQNQQFSEVVARPTLGVGSVTVQGDTHMWGADVNARRHLAGGCDYRLDGLLGFRYLNLGETLTISESVARTPDFVGDPNAPPGTGVNAALGGTVVDRFRTDNNFYGPQVGLAAEVRRGRYFAELRASVALGTVFQRAEISGRQDLVFAEGPARFEGGLLALPGANIGTFSQRKFGVVPEVGFKLGAHLTDRWRVNVGYNFLYLNSVLRPGDQIDPGLDVSRIPNFPIPGGVPAITQVRPAPTLRTTGVFTQGISFGLSWAF